jgi:cellulose synthase (UDP-forming)
VPVALLASGAQTSTASPAAFTAVFTAAFLMRLWGAKRLYRHQLSWTNALALRILRIPVGLSCAWWLLTRRTLEFQVTPKEGSLERTRGRVPRVLWVLLFGLGAVLGYAAAGLADVVPWRASASATAASGAWLVLAATAVALGARRIRAAEFASSRRNAHRFGVRAQVRVDGVPTELVDISVGGVCVRVPEGHAFSGGMVELSLPGTTPVKLYAVRAATDNDPHPGLVSLRALPRDWAAMRTLALWLFHTPVGAVPSLPAGVPAAASVEPAPSLATRNSRAASARMRQVLPATL